MDTKNVNVESAYLLLKRDGDDWFVFAHMLINESYEKRLKENVDFLSDESLGVKPIRLAGFRDPLPVPYDIGGFSVRRILYHTESSEEWERLLDLFQKGEAYSIDDEPVVFKLVKDERSEELEISARRTIEQYRKVRAEARR